MLLKTSENKVQPQGFHWSSLKTLKEKRKSIS
jgi:hypothetical protein